MLIAMSFERRYCMTTTDRSTVVGVFEIHSEADAAIHELQRAGFRDDQIGFVVRNEEAAVATVGDKTEAAAGAAAGAVSGGMIGGVIGAAAALLIPGFGPAIAGGILLATFGAAGIGALAGSIIGTLVSIGVPEEEARHYQRELEKGHTIVTVKSKSGYDDV